MIEGLEGTNFSWLGDKYEGKVRDVYNCGRGEVVLISTDRQSAFDKSWGVIPLKGQVLTQISAWWFEKVADVVNHHVIANPDPNVLVVNKLDMLPVEVVVRSYLTGSTQTSIWVNYEKGERKFGGITLPDGMKKNDPLPTALITPTTKSGEDVPITGEEIVRSGLVSKGLWEEVTETALRLFRRGQEIAAQNNLILVDTKYEFGLDNNGRLTVGDEVHTPDSSRFWVADTLEKRTSAGLPPESLDKEFFRGWLIQQGFVPSDPSSGAQPVITPEVQTMLSQKYIDLYQRVTRQKFVVEAGVSSVAARIERNLRAYFG
ncbi:phosphoribosylaminoimidazolesuccinocarboxamide synthase [bacterium]|nr:phosphoribosylaminoimidazolesuccinocarboxamide synthase [bacterium]